MSAQGDDRPAAPLTADHQGAGVPARRELEQALRPFLARVRLGHLFAWGWRGLLAALSLAGLVLGLARAFPWYGAGWWAVSAFGLTLAATVVGAWLTRPDLGAAAQAADRLGLAERAVTALELAKSDGELARRQREDALHHLRRLEPSALGLPRSRRWWAPVALSLGAVVLLAAAPNPMATVASRQNQERLEARRQAEKVGRLADQLDAQLAKQGSDADPHLKETLEALKRLQQELRRARNGQEAERALAQAREQLQRQADPSSLASARGLDQLAKSLAAAAMTEPAGKKLEQGLSKEAAEALRQAAAALQSGTSDLTEAERQQLAVRLQQAANAARGNQSLASALRQMAQALSGGQQGSSGSAAASGNGAASAVSGAQAQAVAQALQSLAGAVQAAGSSVSGQATLAALAQQLGQLQGQMLAAASGQAGSGQGQGSGSGGSGAGSGSSNGDGGQGGPAPAGNGGPLGQTNRPGQTGSYERIYAPRLLGGDGQGSMVGGSAGGSGQEDVVNADGSPAVAGELVPYDRVWASYEGLIRDSLERGDLPPAMADVLRQYFSSLEPGQ